MRFITVVTMTSRSGCDRREDCDLQWSEVDTDVGVGDSSDGRL